MKRPSLRWALAAASLPFLPISAPKPVSAPSRIVIGQRDMFGEGDVAVFVEQADMAVGRHHVGVLVVGDRVGQQDAPVIVDLDMALRDDDLLVGS